MVVCVEIAWQTNNNKYNNENPNKLDLGCQNTFPHSLDQHCFMNIAVHSFMLLLLLLLISWASCASSADMHCTYNL